VDLNHLPTAVGRILSVLGMRFRRKDLNDLHTAVWRISYFNTKPRRLIEETQLVSKLLAVP
jgi:hypothetical protein